MLFLIAWHQHPVDRVVPWEEGVPPEPYLVDAEFPARDHSAFERQLRADFGKRTQR
jgi:hypothetical protein